MDPYADVWDADVAEIFNEIDRIESNNWDLRGPRLWDLTTHLYIKLDEILGKPSKATPIESAGAPPTEEEV